MKRWTLCLAVISLASSALAAAPNLARNPSFESDANAAGVPDDWACAGDSRSVAQALTLDTGRDGKRCAKLTCTRFAAEGAASHAMLHQLGIPVKRGETYRVSLWAKGEKIGFDIVSVALSDTSSWSNCGLSDAFAPTPDWQRFEFSFQATRDCGEKSRFQLWFGSTGTLWVDDVEFAEAGPEAHRPGHIIPAAGRKNLIPNSSFECWYDGWGSAEWDRAVHWGGRMNSRFGALSPNGGFHGQCSLYIDLSPDSQPVSYFDYYELSRTPIWAPLAANVGWLEVEPGKPYTFSAYLRAADGDTPARLAVRQFEKSGFEKGVKVSTKWERYSLAFTPTERWCYVLAGPDLRKTSENPDPPRKAALWLDAFQLEQGAASTPFQPRDEVEFRIVSEVIGVRAHWGAAETHFPVYLRMANASAQPRSVKLELQLTDFFDNEVWRQSLTAALAAGEAKTHTIPGKEVGNLRGFFRLHAQMTDGDTVSVQTIRLVCHPPPTRGVSRFGVNHAYPWPHLLDDSRDAGVAWVRDWSLKWQEVEPEKGKFNFTEADHQIERPIKHGLSVLGLLPFPSSNWSSSAPESVKVTAQYPGNRARVAYAPRDVAEFENYVEKTVAHYKGRITWWQCFNEPLYTDYSLPRKLGYDGATYAKLVNAFARAARRANPDAKVLAGMGGLGGGQTMADFEKFFAAGGLAACDAVDIHHYPRIRPPEFVEGLLEELNALMDKHGGRKPLWLTEYGYYAEDEPWTVPLPHSDFDKPLPSERVQAEYAVRWATLCFANGVEKVFYHAGTCGGINSGSLQGVFFEYSGQPHKIYAAQAVMSSLFTTSSRFVKKLSLGEGVRAYLFRDGERAFAVVWAPKATDAKSIRLASDKLVLWDIMGHEQKAREFAPSGTPAYVIGSGLSDEQFEAALK